jgi:hypothetical protein
MTQPISLRTRYISLGTGTIAIGCLFALLAMSGPWSASQATAEQQEPAVPSGQVDEALQKQLDYLRLTAENLAAVGCTTEQAKTVVQRLDAWLQAQSSSYDLAVKAHREASTTLSEMRVERRSGLDVTRQKIAEQEALVESRRIAVVQKELAALRDAISGLSDSQKQALENGYFNKGMAFPDNLMHNTMREIWPSLAAGQTPSVSIDLEGGTPPISEADLESNFESNLDVTEMAVVAATIQPVE